MSEIAANIRHLTEDEFLACFSAPMRDVSNEASAVLDIWPYVQGLDAGTLEVGRIGDVAYVYEDAQRRFHHVILETDRHNVFVAIVVSLSTPAIAGHRLLDMNRLYGLEPDAP